MSQFFTVRVIILDKVFYIYLAAAKDKQIVANFTGDWLATFSSLPEHTIYVDEATNEEIQQLKGSTETFTDLSDWK